MEKTAYNRAKIWQIALFALNMMSTNLYLFLMGYVSYYATGLLGLATVFVTTLATAMRIFDGVTDPFIGWLMDHVEGRFGKFRPFLLIGNGMLMLSMILMYRTTHLVPDSLRIPYFIAVYALYILGYTVQGTVTTAAQTLLTNDPKQRPLYGGFTGIYMVFMTTGFSWLVSGHLVPKYGEMGYDFFNELIWWVMGAAFGMMLCAFAAIAPKDKKEYYEHLRSSQSEKASLSDYWAILRKNKALQMLIVAESTDKLAMTIANNSIVTVMLFGIIIGNYSVMGRLSVLTMIPNLILLFIGIAIARSGGQKRIYVFTIYGCTLLQVCMTLLFLCGDPKQIDLKSFGFMNVAFVVLYLAINGIRNIGSNMMIPMMADCTDYELYRSGYYVPGMVATVYSFVDKLISSFGMTIVGALVALIGYAHTAPQIGEEMTTGILCVTMILYNGMPIAGWLISIVAMKYYPLDHKKMHEIEEHISRRGREGQNALHEETSV